MSGRLMVAAGFAAAALMAGVAAEESACKRCDQRLELSAAQWACLKERLPGYAEQKTSLVFFSLPKEGCGAAFGDAVRSSETKLPRVNAAAPRVYRLSRAQVSCLSRAAPTVKPVDGAYVFDFAAACPAAPADPAAPPSP